MDTQVMTISSDSNRHTVHKQNHHNGSLSKTSWQIISNRILEEFFLFDLVNIM